MEKDKEFDEYYRLISNRGNDRVFSPHSIAKDIVKSLFNEAETKGLNTKEILQILETVREMILKFKPTIPDSY